MKPYESFVQLSCQHEFCKDCLIHDWTIKIKARQISGNILKCPSDKCKIPINYYILKENLSVELFAQYDSYCLDQFTTDIKNEKGIHCPKCSQISIIHKKSQYFNCPVCEIKYCANEKCLGIWKDHEKLTCEEYQKDLEKKRNVQGFTQKQFESYVLENKLRRCPVCDIIIEKIGNCNYITCESQKCQKKTNFCYICGEILKGNQLKKHYKNSNYYSTCEKKREIELQQMRFDINKEENIKCPFCGLVSKENFEICNENDYKICKCKSKLCNNKYFCLYCQQKIEEENNKGMIKHQREKCLEKLKISKLGKIIFIVTFFF